MDEISRWKTVAPEAIPLPELFGYLTGAVAPRPIALVSTTNKQKEPNLSPFSFFNVFGAAPPTLVFSPSIDRNQNTKHTYDNVGEHPEAVVSVVNYAMAEQVSLSSAEYPKGINEFVKAGLTAVPSMQVLPPRVGESPVSFECRVRQVIATGKGAGAGNLVICEILLIHIKEEVMHAGTIDTQLLDPVGRMGGDWYCRAKEGMFAIQKPIGKRCMGVDNMPKHVRESPVLTGNDLGKLGNVEVLPAEEAVARYATHPEVSAIRSTSKDDFRTREEKYHQLAQRRLALNRVEEAWKILLQSVR